MNNQEAKILVGESRPYATNSVVQGSNTTTTATTLTFIEVGVKLFVKPTINQDGFVSMKIRPEISSVSGSYTYGSPATTVPIVSTTQAETTVSVKDRQTIIIAGLIKDERTGAVDKIPYLGDLPVLGNIFRKTDNEVKKQEIVIFLTPRIITGDSDYMEIPPSKMPEEKNFTMTEKGTFERRGQLFENPGLFKETSPFSTDQSAATTTFNKQIIPNSVEEYYYLLKNKIVENIRLPKSNNGKSAKGTVKLSFYLNADGRLASMPEIRESSNPSLDDAAKEAVKKSEPFQAFPSQLSQPKKQFIVDLVFE